MNNRQPIVVRPVVEEELLVWSSVTHHVAAEVVFYANVFINFSDVPNELVDVSSVREVVFVLQCGSSVDGYCLSFYDFFHEVCIVCAGGAINYSATIHRD